MSCRKILSLFCFIAALSCCSCSGKPDYGKKTFPVTGAVFVDGEAAAGVSVTLQNVNGMDKEVPSVSSSMSGEDGTFAVSTFEEGDGVPAGDYVATFKWGKLNMISMSYEGDKLKGRYADPKKSEIKVTVKEGEPTDMGKIELSSKK